MMVDSRKGMNKKSMEGSCFSSYQFGFKVVESATTCHSKEVTL